MLYYNKIDVSEGIDVSKNSVIFTTIGTFKIIVLSCYQMSVIGVMIY